MKLTPLQQDAINELANIAVGKSAQTLSLMIGRRILITIPSVQLMPRDVLQSTFQERYREGILGVTIRFDGIVTGTTTLFFERTQGKTLVDNLLTASELLEIPDEPWGGEPGAISQNTQEDDLFTDTDKAALLEVGNIMINGLMGSISNMFNTILHYSIPTLQLDYRFEDGNSEKEALPDSRYAIVLETQFEDENECIKGMLILIFDLGDSSSRFLEAVTALVEQTAGDF